MRYQNPFAVGLNRPSSRRIPSGNHVNFSNEDQIRGNVASDPQSYMDFINLTYALRNGSTTARII